jgi:hypothetical protein
MKIERNIIAQMAAWKTSEDRNDELFQLFETIKDPARLLGQLIAYTPASLQSTPKKRIFPKLQQSGILSRRNFLVKTANSFINL